MRVPSVLPPVNATRALTSIDARLIVWGVGPVWEETMLRVVQKKSAKTHDAPAKATEPARSPVQLKEADYATGAAMLAPQPVQLKKVTNGPDLAKAQDKLNQLGFQCGKADGLWGPKTAGAVLKFQRANGLSPDGVLSDATYTALMSASGSAPADKGAKSGGGGGGGAAKPATPSQPTGPTKPSPEKEETDKNVAKETAELDKSAKGEEAPKDKEAKPGEMSEGDRLRAAVAAQAEEGVGEYVLGKDKKAHDDAVAKARGKLKNYTTCIDFAGKTMRGGVREMYGADKKGLQTAVMLNEIKTNMDLETQADGVSKNYAGYAAKFQKAIDDLEAKKAAKMAEIEGLKAPAAEGENEWSVKSRHQRAKALEGALKQYDHHIKLNAKQRDKFQALADKNRETADAIAAKNSALIKTEPGMTNGRPKVGEYIMLVAYKGGNQYNVGDQGNSVVLAAGAFKHIAIFMGLEVLGNGMEKWETIDGGGDKGKKTTIYVRTSDGARFYKPNPKTPEPGKPWTGDAATTRVGGWIDMDKLIEMRDKKYSG